ncbi:MAG TPA: trehalose-phosphatase [Egibacteraceae bacterium]|nr:trehalose-phosphatase [Egibacteraceae bacterium]
MRSAEEAIDLLVAHGRRAGLFLDFDGTLAPIVADPDTSAMPPELAPLLTEVATALGVLAVVSGRPAAFLAERVRVDGAALLGLYGLETWDGRMAVPRPDATEWRPRVREGLNRLRAALDGADGIWVEDKGLAVAVHWRNAADRPDAEREVGLLVEALSAETGLAHVPGKLVAELRPPVRWDKGDAVRALSADRGLAVAVYVGDDLGDLPAFAAAREHGGMGVAVSGGEETPPELLARADAALDGPGGLRVWLEVLRERLTGA